MNFLVIFFVALPLLIGGSESIELDCSYFNDIDFVYGCKVQNSVLITSKTNRDVSGIGDTFEIGKSDKDVKYFEAIGITVNFFPRGITKFFKNIDNVWVNSAELKEISKDDLKQFGEKLKVLNLFSNEIEVIEGDLFEFSPNLESINFSYNKIFHIDSGAFDGLKYLEDFHLGGNRCTSAVDTSNSHYSEAIREAEKSCKNFNYIKTRALAKTVAEFYEKFSNLESKLVQNSVLAQNIATAVQKNFKLEWKVSTLVQNFTEFSQKISTQNNQASKKWEEQKSEISSLKVKLSKVEDKVKEAPKEMSWNIFSKRFWTQL
jgi:Leucine-rich repeat (LRR) protein